MTKFMMILAALFMVLSTPAMANNVEQVLSRADTAFLKKSVGCNETQTLGWNASGGRLICVDGSSPSRLKLRTEVVDALRQNGQLPKAAPKTTLAFGEDLNPRQLEILEELRKESAGIRGNASVSSVPSQEYEDVVKRQPAVAPAKALVNTNGLDAVRVTANDGTTFSINYE